MDWMQFCIFMLTIVGLFLWNRAETRRDMRQMDNQIEAFRDFTRDMLLGIQAEVKDFHGRLCAIEEKNKW